MSKESTKKKKTWNWQAYVPYIGELLMWKCGGHAIYDDFPCGNRVTSEELGIDFYSEDSAPRVVDIATEQCRRWHKGKKRWHVSEYVAVKFEVAGRMVWTNFSRDNEQWLWTASEMRAFYGQE